MSAEKTSDEKRWPKNLLLVAVVLAGLFAVMFYLGSNEFERRVAVAKIFCERVQSEDFQSALALTSKAFQSGHTGGQLEAVLWNAGGLECADAEWGLAELGSDGLGAIVGEIGIGGSQLRLAFVEEDDGLKIESISNPLAQLSEEGDSR